MDYLMRENYDLELTFEKKILFWTYTYNKNFKFNQASAYDTLEFLKEQEKESFNMIVWVINFLSEQTPLKKKEKNIIIQNIVTIIDNIKSTYFKWAFNRTEEDKKNIDQYWLPMNAYIMILSEKMNIDPLILLKRYTFEQLTYFTEWIIYNMNEQSEDWQKRNRQKQIQKKYLNKDNKDNQMIDKLLDSIPD